MINAAPPASGGGDQRPLALTMGDPAGIGGEITLKAWQANKSRPFFIIDDADRLEQLSQSLSFNVPVSKIDDPAAAIDVYDTALPVLHRPIRSQAEHTNAIIQSISTAVDLVKAGQASAVVTNPINKKSLYDGGFDFPGHTEFLAHLANIDSPPVMMLCSPQLRVVPVTVHLGLEKAISSLNQDDIVSKALITAEALKRDFAIAAPRLAIAGLNPHAGEGGAMGEQEQTIIAPAIARLHELAINASGPWPPDTLFNAAARDSYDVAICMYHDQALIPIKTLDFDNAVNVTLGLPFIRTSPDHGTAYDIAGTGRASATSLLAALQLAAKMADKHQS